MGASKENSISPMKVVSYHDILPVIDVELDERMEILDVTPWYMESIGPNEESCARIASICCVFIYDL